MIVQLTSHLWQSTFFALAAGLLTVAFRRNRAQVRYWLWLSASLKFFIPFSLLIGLGSHLEWAPSAHRIATEIATPAISDTLEQFSQPFLPVSSPSAAPTPEATHWIPAVLFTLWLCGFITIALIRFRSCFRIQSAIRASAATNIPSTVEVRSSPGLLEPGVVGLFRPILLLPEGIAERLAPAELEAVIAHELCHVRRRDNLLAALHMLVEAAFWFHPLVWWIGARLVEERERACDEEVVRQGNQPGVYADAILNLCKLYVESPLACVSGVTGASIRRRVEAIMTSPAAQGLSSTKKILLASVGLAALTGPIVIGLLMGLGNAPTIRAQSPPPQVAQIPASTLPAPVQIAQAVTRTASPTPGAHKLKFDVASIKPCASEDNVQGPGRGAGGTRGSHPSPGRLSIGCATVLEMVENSYAIFGGSTIIGGGEPLVNNDSILLTPGRVRGGPTWAHSDRYSIEAETNNPVANGPTEPLTSPASLMMLGPMLQSLLEDRFQLKAHRDTEEIPMYALTVAKGGLKLKPTEEGICVPPPPPGQPSSPIRADGKPWCGRVVRSVNGPNRILSGSAVTISRLAQQLSLDRRVLDQTGIQGSFDINLEFAPDETTPCDRPGPGCTVDPNSDIPAGQSIFTALERLGLKLGPIKGPRGYIVIDHVERPSEN